MFGTVMPLKADLKIKEFEIYRAYYCGICHSIKNRYGNIRRLTLSFDSVFLAIFLESIFEEDEKFEKFRCLTHPIMKKTKIIESPALNYAADTLLILSYYNLIDDSIDDKNFIKGLFAKIIKSKKLFEKYKNKILIIEKQLQTLSDLEKKNSADIDEVSVPFAKILEEIFNYNHDEEENPNSFALKQVGYNLGKWIYTVDAIEDYEKDKKKNKYNPILSNMLLDGVIEKDELKNYLMEKDFVLKSYIKNIADIIPLLNIRRNKNIIENIVLEGLLNVTENTINKRLSR
ncbi:MAG: DUF5685 family protein [Clostridiales Family XIII bacterium]|jgi:hypothetical protein|nr:DUF5685 family protein [Clostridiales Family XIII bacterium]